jgi:hypothetical protein
MSSLTKVSSAQRAGNSSSRAECRCGAPTRSVGRSLPHDSSRVPLASLPPQGTRAIASISASAAARFPRATGEAVRRGAFLQDAGDPGQHIGIHPTAFVPAAAVAQSRFPVPNETSYDEGRDAGATALDASRLSLARARCNMEYRPTGDPPVSVAGLGGSRRSRRRVGRSGDG